MKTDPLKFHRMTLSKVYPAYVAKANKKGRTQEEVDQIIYRLTGYDQVWLQVQIDHHVDFKSFFDQAPRFNPLADKITGSICGYRISEITDPLVKKVRYLDKLIDELAQGKTMDKILRR